MEFRRVLYRSQSEVATKSSLPFLWLLRRMAIVGAPQYISHVYLARHARSKVSYSSSSTCSFKRNNALFRHLEIQDEQGLLGFGLPIYQHPMESNLTLAAQMLRDASQGPPTAPMRRLERQSDA